MTRKGFKYRIYPNTKQKEYFAKCFGCVRFFYNKSLNDMIDFYKENGSFKDINPTTYKKDYPFLQEIDSIALHMARYHRNKAFKSFFAHRTRFPKFKSKKDKQSYTTLMVNGNIKISSDNKYLTIPKCRKIKIKLHRAFDGEISSVTITRTSDDQYYVSFITETNIEHLQKSKKVIGLDLGVKDLITDSNGEKYKNHKYLTKTQTRLAREQRKLSKMVKGSNNRNKQRIRIAKLYKKIQHQRNDYLQKLSRHIIDENQIICVENLKIKNMAKNHYLAESISDASWFKLITMLIYKAKWYGRTIVKVPTTYPSSQLCSKCGHKYSFTKCLGVRRWICPECGTTHDRDINAARNILSKGIEILTKDGTHPDSLFMLDSLESSSKKPSFI